MAENKDSPAVIGGAFFNRLFKPLDLLVVNVYFVGRVDGITEDRGAKTNNQGFIGNLDAMKTRKNSEVH